MLKVVTIFRGTIQHCCLYRCFWDARVTLGDTGIDIVKEILASLLRIYRRLTNWIMTKVVLMKVIVCILLQFLKLQMLLV